MSEKASKLDRAKSAAQPALEAVDALILGASQDDLNRAVVAHTEVDGKQLPVFLYRFGIKTPNGLFSIIRTEVEDENGDVLPGKTTVLFESLEAIESLNKLLNTSVANAHVVLIQDCVPKFQYAQYVIDDLEGGVKTGKGYIGYDDYTVIEWLAQELSKGEVAPYEEVEQYVDTHPRITDEQFSAITREVEASMREDRKAEKKRARRTHLLGKLGIKRTSNKDN